MVAFASATPGRSMAFVHLPHLVFYFLLHFHSFDGITDVNALAFMCLELMGQWSWGAVLACKTSFFLYHFCMCIHHVV
jgi:hypothetical protein